MYIYTPVCVYIPWNSLRDNSNCQELLNTYSKCCGSRIICKQPPELQTSIYNIDLYVHHFFNMREFLCRKLKRWFQGAELRKFTGRALKLCEDIRSHAPPCVLHALLITFLNGWCTDRRFQKKPRSCLLCDLCTGVDSIEHYAVCPYMWAAAQYKLRISSAHVSLSRFFAVEPARSDDVVILAANTYAVLSVTNQQRAVDTRCSNRDLPSKIWDAHRTLSVTHSGLRKRYINVWTA